MEDHALKLPLEHQVEHYLNQYPHTTPSSTHHKRTLLMNWINGRLTDGKYSFGECNRSKKEFDA